jgi:DNA-binding CsgD family transcriptional regulator
VDDAVAEAQLGLADVEEFEQELLVPLALSTLATVALRRGDLSGAAEHIDRCRARVHTASGAAAVRATWLAGQLAVAQGDAGWAMEQLVDIYDDPRSLHLLLSDEPAAAGWLVRNALAARDRDRADAAAARVKQLSEDDQENVGIAAAAAHARGLLTGSVAALRCAVALYRDPWVHSSAAEDLGVLLAGLDGQDDRREAIRSLDDALSGYESTGAARDVARVRRRLRELGIRRRHWNRLEGPASGWESLTETERTVADLVAAGLTNRQVARRLFLSPHTVAFHLRHIFRKLAVTSRVDLARLIAHRVPE